MKTFIYNFRGFGNCESKCRVYVTEIHGITHICFEELEDNPGTSVTNVSEQLATEILKYLNLPAGKCKFFESYPETSYRRDRSFEEILYTWNNNTASSPSWLPSKDKQIFEF